MLLISCSKNNEPEIKNTFIVTKPDGSVDIHGYAEIYKNNDGYLIIRGAPTSGEACCKIVVDIVNIQEGKLYSETDYNGEFGYTFYDKVNGTHLLTYNITKQTLIFTSFKNPGRIKGTYIGYTPTGTAKVEFDIYADFK